MGTTYTRKQRVAYDVEDRDDLYETKMPSSARRYKTSDTVEDLIVRPAPHVVQQRRSSLNARPTGATTAVVPVKHTSKVVNTRYARADEAHTAHSKHFFFVFLGVGMLITVLLLFGMTFVSGAWQKFQDDMHYGYPRTHHMDEFVGHNESKGTKSHFVFINYHGQIQFIQIAGGDPAQTRIFTGPKMHGKDQDLLPVTGKFVENTKTGKKDLILLVGNQEFLYTNDGKTFIPGK